MFIWHHFPWFGFTWRHFLWLVFLCRHCVSGFMCVTFGYAVLVYLKEAMAKDGLIGVSSQEYKLEINPGDSFGLNPVAGQACVHPVLDLWHPELRQYFKDKGRLQCADDENWVYVPNGTFRINERARQKHGEIHCEYTPQLRGEYTPQLRGAYTLQLRGHCIRHTPKFTLCIFTESLVLPCLLRRH